MAGSKSVKLGPVQDVSLKLIRLRDYRKEQEEQEEEEEEEGLLGSIRPTNIFQQPLNIQLHVALMKRLISHFLG